MDYFCYWGKAKPTDVGKARYHLLVYHCLDVAAVGQQLLQSRMLDVPTLARQVGLAEHAFRHLLVYWLVLHDLGKFSRAFQGLAPNLDPALVPAIPGKIYSERHDTLGWLLWRDELQHDFPDPRLPTPRHPFWAQWAQLVVGHHGMPPKLSTHGGTRPLEADSFFTEDDVSAARQFVRDLAFLLPDGLPQPTPAMAAALRQCSWTLAGFAILADWLGSNTEYFLYHDQPGDLQEYWKYARQRAADAIAACGLLPAMPAPFGGVAQLATLFPYLLDPTPLQQHAASVPLAAVPQLYLLEDVTGAGKTEAALILVHRLMAAGLADGWYFGLPTMATANQMYRRVGNIYQQFYRGGQPSVVLAHGARNLVDDFQLSLQPWDRNYRTDEATATAQCNAWLADNNKKALLAHVGVGSVDQALLAVLPARHQSLRLYGMARKVLVIDEVHCFDAYVFRLLRQLLQAHAAQGGSAVLLSATLPINLRQQLVDAYQAGRGGAVAPIDDARYPLAIQVADQTQAHHCASRPDRVRRLAVRPIDTADGVLDVIQAAVEQGLCVAWVRNTVDDAMAAYAAVQTLPGVQALLFHSRFAMGHRLDIENQVLDTFGKTSTAEQRRGCVLIGTQVIENSLDLCFDLMVSDLAPIDLLIQRAGRLQRHVRDVAGNPASAEGRPSPCLYVHGPAFTAAPPANWYSSLFPKARYVYPNVGQLWLTQRALTQAQAIATPGTADDPAAVRNLVEAVYGVDVMAVPEPLQQATQQALGELMGQAGMADFNALDLAQGYCQGSSHFWDEDTAIPTRLGDATRTVYLAVADAAGDLQPLVPAPRHAWELSAVRLRAQHISALAPAWQTRYAAALQRLRGNVRLLEEPALVLPLEIMSDGWTAETIDSVGNRKLLLYKAGVGCEVCNLK